jgi:glycosyltransferase involved in cell wall biosynthesis
VLVVMEPLIGGTLRHLEHLLAYTERDVCDVHLAVSAGRDPSVRARFAAWRSAGWPLCELPMVRRIAPHRDLAAWRALLSLCRRERFDVVHSHCAKAGFLGRLAGRMTGARTVHTPHVFPFGRGGPVAAEALYLALERLAGRWTDRLVVLSRYQQGTALWRRLVPPERAVLIPNGVPPEASAGPTKGAARRMLGLERDEPVALAVGRLCRQKGYDILLAALGRVRRQGQAPTLLIVGEGPQAGELAAQASAERLGERVRFVGAVDDVRPYYAACDVLAMPSRFEGMPYVVLEAKAAGRPVAASLVSGMEEFVRHGRDGLLLPAGNAEAWAALLARMGGMRRQLWRMGQRARRSLRGVPSAEERVEALHAVYRDLAAQKRRAQPGGPTGA